MTGTTTTVREAEGDMVVSAVDRQADGVVVLTLVDPDGDALPAWTPGAHVDLILGPRPGAAVLAVRPSGGRSQHPARSPA